MINIIRRKCLKRNELVRKLDLRIFRLINRFAPIYCGCFAVCHLLSDSVFTTLQWLKELMYKSIVRRCNLSKSNNRV